MKNTKLNAMRLYRRYCRLEISAEEIRRRSERMADAVARAICPAKVGTIVRYPVPGSYYGKRLRVTRVDGHVSARDFSWRATGQFVDRDGCPTMLGRRYGYCSFSAHSWDAYPDLQKKK